MTETQPIYDIRVRPPYKGFLECVMYKNRERTTGNMRARGMAIPHVLETLQMADCLRECAEANVVKAIVPAREPNPIFDGAPNSDVLELAALHPKLFVAAIAVDPVAGGAAVAEIRKHAANPSVVAVVIEPGLLKQPAYLDDPRINPVWEECASLGLPVLAMGGGVAGPDVSYADPTSLDRAAVRFPKCQFVAVHGGWPYVTQMLGIAFRRSNIYVCADLYMLKMPGWRDYVDAANLYLEDRFLFGTAYPFNGFKEYAEKFSDLPFRREILPKLMHDNAARLFARRATH